MVTDIKQAIEAAKQDPTSAYAVELRKRIENGSFNKELEAAGLRTFPQKPTYGQDAVSDIKETGTAIKENLKKNLSKVITAGEDFVEGEQGFGSTALQALGSGANAVGNIVGETIKGAGKVLLPEVAEEQVGKAVEQGVSTAIETVPYAEDLMIGYKAWAEKNPVAAKNLEATIDIASLIPIGKGVSLAKTGVVKTATGVAETASDVAKSVASTPEKIISNITPTVLKGKEKVISLLSPDVDEATKNVLKNTDVKKFDKVVKLAQEASDPTKPSTYEVVANSMSSAAKQLDKQVKSLANQKNILLGKAATGLTDFSKQTGKTILEINRSLKNNPVGTYFIQRLKSVKTKLDADKAIDELQNYLYKGNKDMTIPTGSIEDKTLRGIIGKYNTKLKKSLPESYGVLNDKMFTRLKDLNILNRSLGEVVNGVPTRGAGLVKQFFSPAGTKTKQLFANIKNYTGVDLAEDTILAKYIGEAFGDTKLKSLLEGLPTTRTGAIDKAIDFALESTGANKALREAKQSGMLKKARELTKQQK